eukprot:UN34529
MYSVLERLTDSPKLVIPRSILLSVDCAHAIHPNYGGKHERNHGPKVNGGLVIKNNANQRYATTSLSSFHLKRV